MRLRIIFLLTGVYSQEIERKENELQWIVKMEIIPEYFFLRIKWEKTICLLVIFSLSTIRWFPTGRYYTMVSFSLLFSWSAYSIYIVHVAERMKLEKCFFLWLRLQLNSEPEPQTEIAVWARSLLWIFNFPVVLWFQSKSKQTAGERCSKNG